MDEEIEHTLYVNRDVKVYRIPPRPASTGHMSGAWRVADQIFAGRLRMLARGANTEIRLEDINTGELFAVCPFTPATQAVAVEPTVDSSRYFVLRVEDPASKRHAFLGLGFNERGEAFDFNAAMADHAKQCQRERTINQVTAAAAASQQAGVSADGGCTRQGTVAASVAAPDPAYAALYKDPGDLSLKEGQTIRIAVNRPSSRSGGGFLSRAAGGSGSLGPMAAAAAALSPGGGSSSSDGCNGAKGLLPPPPILPPPAASGQQPFSEGIFSPAAAAPGAMQPAPMAAAAANAAAPADAVTVAASQDNWATFD